METLDLLKDLIGLTKEEALAKIAVDGFLTRIESEDGQHYMLTMDMQRNRINISLVDGKVVAARQG